MTKIIDTPWGVSDSVTDIGNGVLHVSTPSHGGYYVPPQLIDRMPVVLRKFKTFAGPGWYEEDVEWCVVCLALPGLFPAEALGDARDVVERKPEYFGERVTEYARTL